MKAKLTLILLVAAVAISAGALTALVRASSSNAWGGDSGSIRRYVAQWTTGREISSTVEPAAHATGGIAVYDVDFFTGGDINTLYVTVSGVGDDHGGARNDLACVVDGNPCNDTVTDPVAGAPSGWVTVMRHPNYNREYPHGATPDATGDAPAATFNGDGGGGAGDLHDNSINYTWCAPIDSGKYHAHRSGMHHVQIRLAAQNVDHARSPQAFLEAAHFFVDGSRIADSSKACTQTP
jgi:hypothetical protein